MVFISLFTLCFAIAVIFVHCFFSASCPRFNFKAGIFVHIYMTIQWLHPKDKGISLYLSLCPLLLCWQYKAPDWTAQLRLTLRPQQHLPAPCVLMLPSASLWLIWPQTHLNLPSIFKHKAFLGCSCVIKPADLKLLCCDKRTSGWDWSRCTSALCYRVVSLKW